MAPLVREYQRWSPIIVAASFFLGGEAVFLIPRLAGASAPSVVEEVLSRRYPLYEAAAECIVDTGNIDQEEVCKVIAAALREKPE